MNRKITLAVTAIAVSLFTSTHGFAADHGDGPGRVGANYFAPTTVSASLGYRAVFAYTDSAVRSRDRLCHVSAQFFDAMGEVITEGHFALRFGESGKLDLEPVNNNGINGQKLVRLVVTHEPMGCLSATSEVTRIGRDHDGDAINLDTCWVVQAGSIVPVLRANTDADADDDDDD